MMNTIFCILAVLLVLAAAFLWLIYATPYPTMSAYLKKGSAYDQAVTALKGNPAADAVETEARKLMEQMTLDEKIYMLSGHTAFQSLQNIVKTRGKRNYHVHPLQAGGCKRLGIPPILFADGR